MSYVYLVPTSPRHRYSFSTTEGQGARVVIPTSLNLEGAQLIVEVAHNSRFTDAATSGTAVFRDGEVVINFSAHEINSLKDGFYRIKSFKDGQLGLLVEGAVDYSLSSGEGNTVLDGAGEVRTEFIIPLTNALDEVFLKKEDYVAGVVDPEILNQAVDTKLAVHIESQTPHPVYDVEMQDLAILFENRLI